MTVLERLADYLESQVRLRNKVSSILIYPMCDVRISRMVVVGVTGNRGPAPDHRAAGRA